MSDYDDLDAYNGDTEHDMYVDYDYNENTDELDDLSDEDEEDDDWSEDE